MAEPAHPFVRPVFIVGAPRSCSTLLFQTLAQSDVLWSLGDESHALFEGHRKLSPGRGAVDSNRLTADVLDDTLARSIPSVLAAQVRDRHGNALQQGWQQKIRLLEKTPKHALRIPFLDALFPDALFIYLVRDPRQNLSSIIEAWRSGRFVTYPRFPTAHGPWSLLLPPGWRDQVNSPLEEIAAFQWCAANRYIIDDLARLEPRRWTAINAAELLQDPLSAVTRLCAFMEIGLNPELRAWIERPLPLSRYTLSPPDAGKWQKNADLLARIWPRISGLIPAINRCVDGKAQPLSCSSPLASNTAAQGSAPEPTPTQLPPGAGEPGSPSRNQPCPCGSGKRFKACHGNLVA